MATEKANGNAPAAGAVVKSNGSNLPTKQSAKVENLSIKAREQQTLTVEEVIRKVAMLSDQINTRRVLFNHLDKLNSLKFGDYDEKDMLVLTNGSGQSYNIKSSALCQKLVDVAKREIQEKILEIEEQMFL